MNNKLDETTEEIAAFQPFKDMVVIEIGHSVAAPFAGQILSEMGARVIKIEKADGDDARKWGPPFWEGASAYFQALNRNKESVVCDFRSKDDLRMLKDFIVKHADVVIQNLRPGSVEKLGIDGEGLLEAKSSLIYCNMGAFGKVGPLKGHPGYDPLMQAFGGIMSTTGEAGRPAVRVGPSIVDMGTGMWAVIAIISALYARQDTGLGKVVDVSLFETATTWVSLLAAQYLASGDIPEKQGSGAPGIAPYKGYLTSDGEIIVAAGSEALFKKLCAVVGREEWINDSRFIDNPSRVKHQEELYRMLDEIFVTNTIEYWQLRLEQSGIPCSPVNNIKQMLEHSQTQALNIVQKVPNTKMEFVGLPMSFNGVRPQPFSCPPALGEHTSLLSNEK